MTAEILSVGTEILLGNITNSNAAFLSRELASLGVAVYTHTAVGDNHARLEAAISRAFSAADIVVTTGGLGPTADDITKTVAAKFFGLELEIHEESRQKIFARFAGKIPENSERNALVPVGAKIFPNDNGCAPGICIERNGKILLMFPGPPHELQPMFLNYAADFLRKKSARVFLSRTLKIIGAGETAVESQLRDLIDAQKNPTIAPYAKIGEVHIRLTASAANEQDARDLLAPVANEIYARLSPKIFAEDDTSLAEIVLALLKKQNHSLAVAESCTGGLVVSELVGVAGCSEILREGLVTYSNESKIARLSVCEKLLAKHGAVSEEVAAAMAKNAAITSGASVGLSTTGIAGGAALPLFADRNLVGMSPRDCCASDFEKLSRHETRFHEEQHKNQHHEKISCEEKNDDDFSRGANRASDFEKLSRQETRLHEEKNDDDFSRATKKPVGLVYVGLFIRGREPFVEKVEKYNLTGDRNVIRTRAAKLALDFLRRGLL
ncbi:MAG: competence/damage-inducible protein A [Defluviitaleaceae bacterium]|nr:competence/damage-inducible protein A [Defluviitaleaceae bacterium]